MERVCCDGLCYSGETGALAAMRGARELAANLSWARARSAGLLAGQPAIGRLSRRPAALPAARLDHIGPPIGAPNAKRLQISLISFVWAREHAAVSIRRPASPSRLLILVALRRRCSAAARPSRRSLIQRPGGPVREFAPDWPAPRAARL